MIPFLDGLDRDAAREAAQRELSKKPYQDAKPSWTYRLINWLFEKVDEALSRAAGVVPGGALGVVLLLLLVVGAVALLVWRTRPAGLRQSGDGLFDQGSALSADQHRQRAEAAAAAGRYADAVRERMRAVARELESRGVVDPRPGRTADELAREAGAAVPVVAEPLGRGTRLFDDVWYGGRAADASSYAVLVEVDRVVREARLARA